MKKESRFRKNEDIASFEDADYQDDMRVDPLTTGERIKQELLEIKKKHEEREIIKLENIKKAKEEENKKKDELYQAYMKDKAKKNDGSETKQNDD